MSQSYADFLKYGNENTAFLFHWSRFLMEKVFFQKMAVISKKVRKIARFFEVGDFFSPSYNNMPSAKL